MPRFPPGSTSGRRTSARSSASSSPSRSAGGSPPIRAARCTPRPRRPRGRFRGSARSRASLAWGGALAAALLVAVFVVRDDAPPASSPETVTMEAARVVTFDAPSNSVAVLPSGAVVDASAVAVLPFAASGDATFAAGLERDVVAALRTVPGLYVIADDAVSSRTPPPISAPPRSAGSSARAASSRPPSSSSTAACSSARGCASSTTGATLWRTDVDRPVDELNAIRYEIAESVAATMLDSSLREQVVYADRSSAPVSASKPIPQ